MKVVLEREEPTTGGPQRTPREQIEPVFGPNDKVEPDARIDASSSEGFEDSAGPGVTTWEVQMEALRQFIAAAEQIDSQAAAEQAGGSDEKGGIYSAFFNQGLVKIGEGDDDGDLNSSNLHRKVSAIRVRTQEGSMVPLPYGATNILPTSLYLDRHYLSEFAKDEETGLWVPVEERSTRACTVWGDGAMEDYEAFGRRLLGEDPHLKQLEEEFHGLWPREEWFVALFGKGSGHDKALKLYQEIARKHSNVHVYSFQGVTSAAEVAEDMAIAVLATR